MYRYNYIRIGNEKHNINLHCGLWSLFTLCLGILILYIWFSSISTRSTYSVVLQFKDGIWIIIIFKKSLLLPVNLYNFIINHHKVNLFDFGMLVISIACTLVSYNNMTLLTSNALASSDSGDTWYYVGGTLNINICYLPLQFFFKLLLIINSKLSISEENQKS